MKERQDRIDYVRELARNTPLPPDLPQIYSFTNTNDYPIDFNMNYYSIVQKDLAAKNLEDAEKINQKIIAPLKIAITNLRGIRAAIPKSKEKREKLRQEVIDIQEELNDNEDSDDEDEIEERLEQRKEEFYKVKEEVI